jgi:hypothetical protein
VARRLGPFVQKQISLAGRYPQAGHPAADAGGTACRPLSSAHAPGMFVVSEAEAAAIRTAFEQGGELSAATELRRRFPGITDNAKARTNARTIAGWKPLPPVQRSRRRWTRSSKS